MRRIFKTCALALTAGVALLLTGCPDDSPSSNNSVPYQPSPSVQNSLRVLAMYSVYLDEYRKQQVAAPCNPYPSCTFNMPSPQPGVIPGGTVSDERPADAKAQVALPFSVTPLVVPSPDQEALPSDLAILLQKDFETLLKKLPPDQSAYFHGWTLKIAPCSEPDRILWLARQTSTRATAGSICLSPVIVRALFVELATEPVPPVVVDLLRYDSTNPFAFNGDSKSLIRAYAAKGKINLTPADLEALSGVIDQIRPTLGNPDQ